MRRKGSAGKLSIFICILLLALSAGGCGRTSAGTAFEETVSGKSSPGEQASDKKADGSKEDSGSGQGEAVAMGRYGERQEDLSERLSGEVNRLFPGQDDKIFITDQSGSFLVSEDSGETWEEQRPDWYEQLLKEGAYITDMAIGRDGTAAVIYNRKEDDEFCPRMAVCGAGGSRKSVSFSLTEEEKYPRKVWITEDGQIFAATWGNILYEVKKDGSSRAFLSLEEGRPELLQTVGNYMILDGHGYGGLVVYDRERKEYIEDRVLDEFVRENYSGRSFFGDNWYDLFFFSGEEGVLYLAGQKGLHRHVMEGSAVEQVIDGSLGSLGDPGCGLLGMLESKGREFLALFTGGRLVRFTYDPGLSAVPGGRIKVYSLKENDTLRQAINLYQSAETEVYVEYEIGMGEDGAVTREDAIKKLNAELMAGNGPDLMVLDGLPLDSYVEKGVLMDLGAVLQETGLEEEIFPNIVEAFRKNGKVYTLPCEISFPVAEGKKEDIERMEDLEGIAGALEAMRDRSPGQDLIEIYSERGVMRVLARICAPAWKTQEGELDGEAVAAFLEAAKRIYNAQIKTLPEQIMERYIRWNEENIAYAGIGREESESFKRYVDVPGFTSGRFGLVLGTVCGAYEYAEMISALRVEGYEETQMRTLSGLPGNVFLPRTLVGINAASGQTQQAAGLLAVLLGKDMKGGDGLFINRTAFEESLIPDMRYYTEGEPYLTTGSSDEDGNNISFSVYWMNEAEKEVLRGWMKAADTPGILDPVLEEAVYAEGEEYMKGEKSLQEAVEGIERKMAVYMAE